MDLKTEMKTWEIRLLVVEKGQVFKTVQRQINADHAMNERGPRPAKIFG